MIGFRVQPLGTIGSAKGNFFDRPAVIQTMDTATRIVFSKFGAFVRHRAQTSMARPKGGVRSKGITVRTRLKNMQGVSAPGEPPFVHVGLIVKHLLFEYDWIRKSVIIGPELLRAAKTPDALNALEYGGHSIIKNFDKKTGGYRNRPVYIQARPFMRPAFEAELPGLPDMWADAYRQVAMGKIGMPNVPSSSLPGMWATALRMVA